MSCLVDLSMKNFITSIYLNETGTDLDMRVDHLVLKLYPLVHSKTFQIMKKLDLKIYKGKKNMCVSSLIQEILKQGDGTSM